LLLGVDETAFQRPVGVLGERRAAALDEVFLPVVLDRQMQTGLITPIRDRHAVEQMVA
jgi:hypothetical protein